MKAIRRFGLIIAVLLLGLLIGKLSLLANVLFFSGLFLTWFMLWDDKRYAQRQKRRKMAQMNQYYYPEDEPREDYYYVNPYDYTDHFHKSA